MLQIPISYQIVIFFHVIFGDSYSSFISLKAHFSFKVLNLHYARCKQLFYIRWVSAHTKLDRMLNSENLGTESWQGGIGGMMGVGGKFRYSA